MADFKKGDKVTINHNTYTGDIPYPMAPVGIVELEHMGKVWVYFPRQKYTEGNAEFKIHKHTATINSNELMHTDREVQTWWMEY